MSTVIGLAGRADDSAEIEVRLTAPVRRFYRVLAGDVPAVLGGYAAGLHNEEGTPVGDIETSASGRMLIGASRAGLGFIEEGEIVPVGTPAFMIPRAHLAAHYHRHDEPVEVLAPGGA
jgi:hypothetical protein